MFELDVHAVVVGVAVPVAVDVEVGEVGVGQPARIAAGGHAEVDVRSVAPASGRMPGCRTESEYG